MVKRSYYTAFQHPVVAHNVYRKCPCRPAGNAQESADSGVHKICDVAKPQTLADVLVKRVLGTLKKEVANRISSACYNERESSLSMQHSMHTRCDLQLDLHITKLQIAYAKFLDDCSMIFTSLNYGLLTQGSWMRPSTKNGPVYYKERSGSWQVTWFGS